MTPPALVRGINSGVIPEFFSSGSSAELELYRNQTLVKSLFDALRASSLQAKEQCDVFESEVRQDLTRVNALDDPDVVRAARYLIAQYGREAESRAVLRRADLSTMGEHDAASIWEQIVYAIRWLQLSPEA